MLTSRTNVRLRKCMLAAGVTYEDLANVADADPKTAQRWVYEGRTPRRRRAERVAAFLGVELFWLWPHLSDLSSWEREGIRQGWQFRFRADDLPSSFLRQTVFAAKSRLWVLTDSNWLLARLLIPDYLASLTLQAGDSPRLLLSPQLVQPHRDMPANAEVRTHPGVHSTSIIRMDGLMMVVPGGLGLETAASPVLFLSRATDEKPFDSFADGFQRLWESCPPSNGRAKATGGD
ncbi:hypothetical protein [Hamadaea tsunoensis]|uniref:hypothetical protein n=1 Tax=Hamadaea tsunoensis TaxID=53368 RepID=UPI0004162FB9|nr:hypothetical protein [Hamadaea tsunoensis]